jgi:hypothetical protein
MGNCFADKIQYFVDDEAPDRYTTVGFSPNAFTEFEWASLKTFCNKRGITQTELNLVFRKHCQYKNAHLTGYRVRLEDLKEHFLKETRITMEMLGLFFPPVLLKEYQGLSPPYSHQEFSFARFVINGYIFCSLPMPDLICVLFSTIKQTAKAKRNLTVDTKIPLITFHHVVRLLSDDLARTGALGYILTLFSRHNPATTSRSSSSSGSADISLEDIIKLGLKYPLLFFEARRFQTHVRRVFFGDKFWETRHYLKTRLEGLAPDADWVPPAHHYEADFATEKDALRVTAAAIVTDVYHVSHNWESGLVKNPTKMGHDSSTNSLSKPPSVSPMQRYNTIKDVKKYKFHKHAAIVPFAGSVLSVLTAGSNAPSSPTAHPSSPSKMKKGLQKGLHDASIASRPKSVAFQQPTGADALVAKMASMSIMERQYAVEKDIFRAAEVVVLRMKLKLTVTLHPGLEVVDRLLCVRLKDLVGFRAARALVLESRIHVDDQHPFLTEYDGRDENEFDEEQYIHGLELAAQLATAARKAQTLKWTSPNGSPAKNKSRKQAKASVVLVHGV